VLLLGIASGSGIVLQSKDTSLSTAFKIRASSQRLATPLGFGRANG
jgi:hypothetical protein